MHGDIRLSIIIIARMDGRSMITLISNHETLGSTEQVDRRQLRSFSRHPTGYGFMAFGRGDLVGDAKRADVHIQQLRARFKRALRRGSDLRERMDAVAGVNRAVSESAAASGTVSSGCYVAALTPRTSQGRSYGSEPPPRMPTVLAGFDLDIHEIVRTIAANPLPEFSA